MQFKRVFFLTSLALAFAGGASAQAPAGTAAPQADAQRRLSDIQTQETELRTQSDQLDQEMLPENLERATTGAGSTHPEELREARRQQLQTAKDGITARIAALEDRRVKIEAATAAAATTKAEVSAAALPPPPTSSTRTSARPKKKKVARHRRRPQA
jgi:hypothetical protein